MADDRDLIKQLAQADPDALRRIYLSHKDQLLTNAICLLGNRARDRLRGKSRSQADCEVLPESVDNRKNPVNKLIEEELSD